MGACLLALRLVDCVKWKIKCLQWIKYHLRYWTSIDNGAHHIVTRQRYSPARTDTCYRCDHPYPPHTTTSVICVICVSRCDRKCVISDASMTRRLISLVCHILRMLHCHSGLRRHAYRLCWKLLFMVATDSWVDWDSSNLIIFFTPFKQL